MDAGEILGVFGHDFQQIIGGAGHQVTFKDVRNAGHLAFKGVQQVIGLTLQGDFHKNRGGFAEAARIQKGDIAGDETILFQPLDPAVAGRGGQIYLIGQIGICDAAILLQDAQDPAVGCVEF